MTTAGRLMTAEEFAALPEFDCRQELVRGVIEESPLPLPGEGAAAAAVAAALLGFAAPRGLGHMFGPTGYVLERDPDTVRGPDVSFVRAGRAADPSRYLEAAPDLAVEIVSEHDRSGPLGEKVREYLAAGAGLVWVVRPDDRTVTVHRPDAPAATLPADGELDGGAVLPGFRCRVADLFA
jgi:Uma2 family endonuclease